MCTRLTLGLGSYPGRVQEKQTGYEANPCSYPGRVQEKQTGYEANPCSYLGRVQEKQTGYEANPWARLIPRPCVGETDWVSG